MDISRAIPIVTTEDPVATRAFYVDVVGMQVVMDEDGFLMLASTTTPGAQVIVTWASATAWSEHTLAADLSLDVGSREQVDAAHARARENGMEIVLAPVEDPPGRHRCIIREPGGARVNIACHVGGARAGVTSARSAKKR